MGRRKQFGILLLVGIFGCYYYQWTAHLAISEYWTWTTAAVANNFRGPQREEFSSSVHVVYAAEGDESQRVALAASISSLLKNTDHPEAVTLHLFYLQSSAKQSRPGLLERAYSRAGTVRIHEYKMDDVKPFTNKHVKFARLQSPANYVRFLLPSWLPDVDSCLWIDADTIVQGDIVTFLQSRNSSFPLAAFPRKNEQLETKMIQTLKTKWKLDVASQIPSFNGGIVVLNLKMWRERDFVKDILYLCKLNDENNLWPLFGSQPPLQLLFADDRFEHLDTKLLVANLGNNQGINVSTSALFLHWNGPFKPWLKNGLYKQYWEKYDLRKMSV